MKFFLCSSSLHEWKIRSCHTAWQSPHMIFFFSISIISRIFTFSPMERTSRLLLGLEALTASLLLRFGAIIMVNKGFQNTHTAITWQLIRTARTLEAEWWQVCGVSVGTGTRGDESSTGRAWAAGFHHVTARSHMVRVLRLMNCLFL